LSKLRFSRKMTTTWLIRSMPVPPHALSSKAPPAAASRDFDLN